MKKKYSFKNDYSELGHENILNAMLMLNREQFISYGEDLYSNKASDLIKSILKNNDVDIHFVSGGTQANLISIAAILKPYESVIAATTGHIAVHEAGAIESNGNKINSVEGFNGKLRVIDIKNVLDTHEDEHMVKPRLVFISNPTEIGTLYTKDELVSISSFCHENNLLLYLDGARLGSALTSQYNDLKIDEICKLVDMFYIGGTKNGALLGEAIVIVNDELKTNFRYMLKQKGALLAKGSLIGIQFYELFKDNLYFDLASHANRMAVKLAKGLEELGYSFLCPYVTNQIFPILPNEVINKIEKDYDFYVWQKIDDYTSAIRLVTSWATNTDMVDEFINNIRIKM